jgi:hypothetical protein
MMQFHGHIIPTANNSHVLWVGSIRKQKVILVVYRDNPVIYQYQLGDSFDNRLCCQIAKLPSPGTYLNEWIKKFPYEKLG